MNGTSKSIIGAVAVAILFGLLLVILATPNDEAEAPSSAALAVEGVAPATVTEAEAPSVVDQSIDTHSADINDPSSEELRAASLPPEPKFEDFKPADLYFSYIIAAENGDQDAQFVVATIAAKCIGLGPNAVADLERRRASPEVIAREQVRESVCAPLVEEVPDLNAVRIQNSQALRDTYYISTMPSRARDPEQLRQYLGGALAWDYPENFLRAGIYEHVVRYYLEHGQPGDEYRREAWALMACYANLDCDSSQMREQLRLQHGSYGIGEIESIESEIISAQSRRQFRDVGFPGGGPPGVAVPR